MKSPESNFTVEQKLTIETAIKDAELNTSGEVRVHIESVCAADVLDRAAYWFEQLWMHKTKLRNGVLFYLSIEDHKFAILGDAGINAKVPEGFWDEIKKTMLDYFIKSDLAEGLSKGIRMAGEQLKAHFPYMSDDINELDDSISFGK